jgi:hypothetical protein
LGKSDEGLCVMSRFLRTEMKIKSCFAARANAVKSDCDNRTANPRRDPIFALLCCVAPFRQIVVQHLFVLLITDDLHS